MVTNEQISLGYGLGDISEHGPPNFGVRGWATWQLQSIAVGGTLVRRMRTNLLTTTAGCSYAVLDTPWSFSAAPPTVGPTVDIGIGNAVNIFTFDMDSVSMGLPGAPGVVFIPPEYSQDIDVFLPPGHAIVFQPAAGSMTGNLAVEWTEYPA